MCVCVHVCACVCACACACVCVCVCDDYSTYCKTFTSLEKLKQGLLNESGVSEN